MADTVILPYGSPATISHLQMEEPLNRYGEVLSAALDGKETSLLTPTSDATGFLAFERKPVGEAASLPVGTCNGCFTPKLTKDNRLAWVRVHQNFEVESNDYKYLRIKMVYSDAVVVRVNGQEVVRRNWRGGAGAPSGLLPARRRRGTLEETVLLPTEVLTLKNKNVLTVEVRPAASKNHPVFDVSLELTHGRKLAVGPLVQRVTKKSAEILFVTHSATKAQVHFGSTIDTDKVALSTNGGYSRRHRVQLDGLEGEVVYYKVVVAGVDTKLRSFRLPKTRDLKFVIYGDMRNGHQIHRRLVESMRAEAPHFATNTGDLVARGTDLADWQMFFDIQSDLLAEVPLYPAVGNHDTGTASSFGLRFRDWFSLWPMKSDVPRFGNWYSFDVAGLRFVVLDSNLYQDPRQLRWFEETLRGSQNSRAVIVVTHNGPYSRGPHGGSTFAKSHYVPLMKKHKVDFLFAGHDHLYQRGEDDGLRYIVTGGGGAPLYPISCGVRGKRRCKSDDGMKITRRKHHYITAEVGRNVIDFCPKELNGRPLEPCIKVRLRAP